MNGNMLLESGKIFRGSGISGIGSMIVDDSESITITPVGYGVAEIVRPVDYPSMFTPGVAFDVGVRIKNTGNFDDQFFIRLTNVDTGIVLIETITSIILAGATAPPFTLTVVLDQTTTFHGLIEVGHEE